MNPPNMLNPAHERACSWLEKHYEATRQRTVGLVKAAVDRLIQDGQTVTIEAICQQSQQLDLQGKGIKKAGWYSWECGSICVLSTTQYFASRQPVTTTYRLPTDSHRDLKQARRRYLRERKADLVERPLPVEQAYIESQQQLARLQFEFLEQQQKAQKGHENRPF
jgi:hypothetical protein